MLCGTRRCFLPHPNPCLLLLTGNWVISGGVWEGQTGPTASQPLSREQATLLGSIPFYSILFHTLVSTNCHSAHNTVASL